MNQVVQLLSSHFFFWIEKAIKNAANTMHLNIVCVILAGTIYIYPQELFIKTSNSVERHGYKEILQHAECMYHVHIPQANQMQILEFVQS